MMEKRLLNLDLRHDLSKRSKHERLKDHLVNEMATGRLKPGQTLPSQRQLVETLGLAPMTVRQAMASLENDGLIRRVQGKGTFVEEGARRKLRRGQDIFALIVPETREGFYPSLLHGFEDAARRIHHQTLICATEDDVERQGNIILQLLDKKIGGVAINPTNPEPTPAYQISQLQERGVPVVFLHRRVEGIVAPLLSLPYYDIGRTAGRALVERGHRRVAFFTMTTSTTTAAIYEDGLRAGVGPGVTIESRNIEERPAKRREESCFAALQEMFAKPDPPTGIFASFDSLAEVIYLQLPRLGLRVPQDVSLVGEGGTWRESALTRQLTSVVIDEIATGRQAVKLLHEMRNGERPIGDNMETVLQPGFYEGKTLAGPASRAPQIQSVS